MSKFYQVNERDDLLPNWMLGKKRQVDGKVFLTRREARRYRNALRHQRVETQDGNYYEVTAA